MILSYLSPYQIHKMLHFQMLLFCTTQVAELKSLAVMSFILSLWHSSETKMCMTPQMCMTPDCRCSSAGRGLQAVMQADIGVWGLACGQLGTIRYALFEILDDTYVLF
ncbi:hypothetical protein ABBQ32_007001 [Trebouxia sp. C0010 RCD-2024]